MGVEEEFASTAGGSMGTSQQSAAIAVNKHKIEIG